MDFVSPGDDDIARSKGTTDGATGEFTSMLAEAQRMFSTISNSNPNSEELESSVGIVPVAGAEARENSDEDDFLPQPPVALYNTAPSSPAPQAQPSPENPADSALAKNWLRVAGTQQTPAKSAQASKPTAGSPAASETLLAPALRVVTSTLLI